MKVRTMGNGDKEIWLCIPPFFQHELGNTDVSNKTAAVVEVDTTKKTKVHTFEDGFISADKLYVTKGKTIGINVARFKIINPGVENGKNISN